MKTINFILGVHNHQPVGNFDFVFEEAYQKAYLPFLKTLEEHPKIRMMYHTSGPLLDWLEEHHPDYFPRLKALVKRNQIEIMTGGYQEPILAVLPDRDKAGQINAMTNFISRKLGAKPRGLWLAERVWEPHLPKPLAECGVEFVTVDDYHFQASGLSSEELRGYYLTDEQGFSIAVFPINMRLRYLIPFEQPEKTIEYLRQNADESGENLLVMCDDGEKFGLWPGTHEWVHEKGWLKRFFQQLEAAMDEGWLKMTTCSEYLDAHPARGRVYLPCASYFEMSQWSLPAKSGAIFGEVVRQFEAEGRMETLKPFLKGGFWRNFISKYDESNFMYRKALWISERIAKIETALKKEAKKNRQLLENARKCLYRAQCNCAYWHGVFGGLYLPHLRHAVYANLIEAEDYCNRIVSDGNENFLEIELGDFDADGSREIVMRSNRISILVSPRRGGAICEFDYLPAKYNLLATLRRQPESYHGQVAVAGNEIKEGASIHDQMASKEEGLDRYLIYDRHLRGALIDHFLSSGESPDTLLNGKYYELGDFVEKPYKAEIKILKSGKAIQLKRTGSVVDNQVELAKTVQLLEEADGLQIAYRIKNQSDIPLTALFAPEFNFAFLAGNSPDRYYRDDAGMDKQPLNSAGRSLNAKIFSLMNEAENFAVHFTFDHPTEVWRYPVETVSQSEGGFERVYQSSCVLPVYRLSLNPSSIAKFKFKLQIEPSAR